MPILHFRISRSIMKIYFHGDKNSPLKFAINSSDNITLTYNQNTLSIDYAVLDYRSQAKESYAYRLLGFDSSWRNNKSARRASYTNLPPGDYLFQVKSTSVDLYSNTPFRSLELYDTSTIMENLVGICYLYTYRRSDHFFSDEKCLHYAALASTCNY